MQQFCADLATDREGSGLSAALFAAACGMQFVLPNRTTLRATREAGLVQIAITQVTIQLASDEPTENWAGRGHVDV